MTLSLTLASTDYDWLQPLVRGEVTPEGVDLHVFTGLGGGERHWRAMRGEFDVAEFSMGTYLAGWPDWEFTAIPAFPRRFFPHSRVFVNEDAGIGAPGDLHGKRVCLTSWQNTLALWWKGVFTEHHGLDLDRVDWYTWRAEPVPVELPVSVEVLDHDAPRAELLTRDELDAIVIPSTGSLYPLPDGVRRLYRDLEAVEGAFHDETGYYPLMHNVVVRDDLVEAHPWLPTELLKAFRRSVAAAAERDSYEAKHPLVWWQSYRERERERFGDVWACSFAFDPNAAELETMARYAHEQGLTDERYDPDDLFHRADEHLL